MLLIICTLIIRYIVLMEFGFTYTDSDQSIMWHGLVDYSQGKFYEPRFYGQAYNTMLEALFAVPLHKLGLPPSRALPVVTTILSLFPFYLIAFFSFLNKSRHVGLVVLSIPLLMPIEYHLITSLSRGFVSGIFIASLGTVSMFYVNNKWIQIFIGLSIVLGYSISANSAILSIPYLFYVFLHNYKSLQFYLYTVIGGFAGSIPHFLGIYFYTTNPGYVLHSFELSYSFDLLIKSFGKLDYYFNYVSPILWNQGFIWLLILLVSGLFAFIKKKRKEAFMMIISAMMLVGTLGLSKVHDASNSIFFSPARMYLALPLLIGTCAVVLKEFRLKYILLAIPFILFGYNLFHLKSTISKRTNLQKNHVVSIAKVEDVEVRCSNLQKVSAHHNVKLIVIVNHGYYDFFNYGCTACIDDFPKTLRPSYERRTWRLIEEESSTHESILFIDDLNDLSSQFPRLKCLNEKEGYYLLKNNSQPTIELLRSLRINIRPYE